MTFRHSLVCSILAGSLTLLSAPPVRAGEVTEQVRRDVSRVFTTLKEARRDGREAPEALRPVIAEMFDWGEMGRRVLGRHWSERTAGEREEFLGLFGGLLRAQIAGLGRVNAADVEYLEESTEGDSATVATRVVRATGPEMRLDYHLQQRDGRWLVYDMTFNHISLLAQYRAQFQRTIKARSWEGLIEKLVTR